MTHPADPVDPDLVVVLCNGPWRVEPMAIRLAQHRGRLLATEADRRLTRALVEAFPDGADEDEIRALLSTPVFVHWWQSVAFEPDHRPVTRSPGALADLTDLAALAVRLDVLPDELEHLARWQRPAADTGPDRARHYRYLVRPTRGGGVRVLEVPKERLKEVQRRVLRRILDAAPVNPAAYGTSPGRGVVAAIGQHTACDVVVSLDIERFFTTLTVARVVGWFAHQGVADEPARLLGRLVTNAVPIDVRAGLPPLTGAQGIDRTWRRDRDLATRHLPQGAPTSPALADRICRVLDLRLAALAARLGTTYTRYVDDLTFSGPRSVPVAALIAHARTIVADEGFRLAAAKTRVQRSSGRQLVLGAVVNDHQTLTRAERDALRATVHNCRTHGWRTQLRGQPAEGFRERLTGRVAWLAALDPVRGRRLLAELATVDWS
ncbi:reverse transcriptase family protein [Jatrophihabitans sp. YIM 134969]